MRIAWPYSFKVSTLRSIIHVIKQIKAKYVYIYMIIFVNIIIFLFPARNSKLKT